MTESTGFGERLARAIKAAGFTQRRFADMLGKSETQISQWKAAANPDMETLRTISTLLGVSIDWLVYGPTQHALGAGHAAAVSEARQQEGALNNRSTTEVLDEKRGTG